MAELVLNGDFETVGGLGFDNWTSSGTYGGYGGEYAHGGSFGLGMFNPTAGVLYQDIDVTPGESYDLSFWTRGDGSEGGRYSVYDNDNSEYIIAVTPTGVSGAT